MKRLISLLATFLILTSCLAASDIKALYEALTTRHPDFFNTVSQEECESFVSALEKLQAENDGGCLYYSLSAVAALAHDSHTGVSLSPQILANLHFIPLGLDCFSDTGLTVVWTDAEHRELLAKKIIGICGKSLDEILEKASLLIPHDNNVFLLSQFMNNHAVIYEFYIATGLVEEGEAVTVTFSDGTDADFTPITWDEYARQEKSLLQQAVPSTLNWPSYYSAMFLDSPDAVLINYHSCQDMSAYTFSEFTEDLKSLFEEYDFSKVVIDLRYNSGGDSSVIIPLVELLKGIQIKRGLEVYVLISEDTFSSAILNALTLKEELNAVLVGRPTGGSVSHYGELGFGILPESGLTYHYSTKCFDNDMSGPLIPDILTERNLADYIYGQDGELKYLGLVK